MEISEKEFAVIREISNNHLPDQRTIATRTGISLGLTNLIIKRLVNKGYVKARQLNQKKIQYLLTPKGFSEKARKSYSFTLRTINVLKDMRMRIQELILEHHAKGATEFTIKSNHELSDIADIIEVAFRNLSHPKINYKREITNSKDADAKLVLAVQYGDKNIDCHIDLIVYLADLGIFIA